jgi:LIVCS family branched-chain amino acid:cation transporter
MQQHKYTLTYGFAIFAMFFGSGNLVFPIQVGQLSGQYWFAGFLGLCVTGIILPFLGLYVIKLYNGSYKLFFGEAGKYAKIFLPFFTLSLLGSFGVVPRCINVAYGGIIYIFPNLSLLTFSLIFCTSCFFLCLKDHFMVAIIGKWLAPIKLISLTILILLGIINAPPLTQINSTETKVFVNGFTIGYQTMDLFAAFFFSSLIFNQIQEKLPAGTKLNVIIKAAIKPSFIGISLLAIIYMGLVLLGAYYYTVTANTSPELFLPSIAMHILGEKATFLISIIMMFSCLTTAVALNNVYARYLYTSIKIANNKFNIVLLLTTLTSFIISLLDFKGIAKLLSPLLEVSYPGIIVLTLMCIFAPRSKSLKIGGFYGMLVLGILKNVW